uniref:Ubiquitin-like domain-containing protein n=1 Tax=Pundamilia nyererei TaxID=303518 RepID=A0A3B4H811_9CICH
MDITINMLGESHTLTVNTEDTVGSLKIKIYEKLEVNPQTQKLVFINGQKTPLNDDSKPISYYGLQHGSQVSLLVTEPPPPAPIQVFLRNEKRHSSTYDIRLDETVNPHFYRGSFRYRIVGHHDNSLSQCTHLCSTLSVLFSCKSCLKKYSQLKLDRFFPGNPVSSCFPDVHPPLSG